MRFPFLQPRDERPGETTFPELVFVHFLRQRELYLAAQAGAPAAERALQGPAAQEYERRLRSFMRRHGEIVDAYWCTHEISAVALTERGAWTWRGLLPHRDRITRLHEATSWATRNAPPIASQIHACESLAIRANEVLLGTSERIVMQLLLALSARLLAVVDVDGRPDPAVVRRAVEDSHRQLPEIHSYYDRAGRKAVRVFYVGGMIAGLATLGLAMLVARAAGAGDHILVAIGMGGAGAVVSVLSRMASRDSRFNLDHEVGQKEARRLGGFRPFVGAAFGSLLYLAVSGGLLSFSAVQNKTLSFYAVISFLAGFSERWAKVVLDLEPSEGERKPAPQAPPAPADEPHPPDDAELAAAAPPERSRRATAGIGHTS